MERKSYMWFERRRRNRALELAQGQITETLNTVNQLEIIRHLKRVPKRKIQQKNVETFSYKFKR